MRRPTRRTTNRDIEDILDITALQDRLRTFAAERGWEPFHTPKNLAIALGVEVAELAEVFQWLTPEESVAVTGDALLKDRVGEEAADVLLYLVQLCDHAGVDLDAAVEHKLVRNAGKYPPTQVGRAAAVRSRPVRRVYALVDWENVQPRDEELRTAVPGVTHVWLFQGAMQRGADASYGSFGDRVVTVPLTRTGKNALDFHLTFYIGYIAARHPDACFVVVSNDQGYAPMIAHACELGFDVQQVTFARTARRGGARQVAARTAVSKKAPARKSGAGKTAARTGAKTAAKTPRKAAAKKVDGTAGKAMPEKVAPEKIAPGKAAPEKAATKKTATRTAAKTAARKTPAKRAKATAPAPADAPTIETAAAPTPAKTRRARTSAAAPSTASAAAPASPATAGPSNGVIAMALMSEPPGRRSPTKKGLLRFIRRQLPAGASEAAVHAALDALQVARVIELTGDAVRYLR